MSAPAIRITQVLGIPLVVTITRADGASVTAYSDVGLTTPVTQPAAISADTTYYVSGQGYFIVSMKVAGVELGPFPVYCAEHQTTPVPVPADADALRRIGVAGAAGTTELGYAERTTNDSTTNTAYASVGSNKISGLSVTVVGEGLPVLVEFFCPSVVHSVANTATAAVLLTNGAVTSGQQGFGEASTSAGLILRRRRILTPGTSYTFEVGKYVVAAGTGTYIAGSDNPMHLAVSR